MIGWNLLSEDNTNYFANALPKHRVFHKVYAKREGAFLGFMNSFAHTFVYAKICRGNWGQLTKRKYRRLSGGCGEPHAVRSRLISHFQ